VPARNPEDRALIARIAANDRWANEPDRSAATAPGRAAFRTQFETLVDPGGVLSPDERSKRASNAKRAYFQRLALKSAQARRARARRNVGGDAA
jgi:hypothetical protein